MTRRADRPRIAQKSSTNLLAGNIASIFHFSPFIFHSIAFHFSLFTYHFSFVRRLAVGRRRTQRRQTADKPIGRRRSAGRQTAD
jgi:hypothetical protein